VFAGVMFSLQTRSIADNVKVIFGADLMVQANTLTDALKEPEMTAFLNSYRGKGYVSDFTFITYDLRRTDPVDSVSFSNLATYPQWNQGVFGVSPNYLSVAYADYSMTTSPTSVSASGYPATAFGTVVRLLVTCESLYLVMFGSDSNDQQRTIVLQTVLVMNIVSSLVPPTHSDAHIVTPLKRSRRTPPTGSRGSTVHHGQW
jgi:hypothetical protein